jgi:hypothetical protein
VRFLYVRGGQGVQAWDAPGLPPPSALDVERYRTLLLRAAFTILQPLGLDERTLEDWVLGNAIPVCLPGMEPADLDPLRLAIGYGGCPELAPAQDFAGWKAGAAPLGENSRTANSRLTSRNRADGRIR